MASGSGRARTILVLSVTALFLWMVRTLLVPVALGGLFALLLYPLQVRLSRELGRARRLSPIVITTGALVLVVLPLTAVATQAVVSINTFLSHLDAGDVGQLQSSILSHLRDLAEAVGVPVGNIERTGTELVQRAGTTIAGFLSRLLSSVPATIIDIFLFVVALYFFLRDGGDLGERLEVLSPFSEDETRSLFRSVLSTVRGAILGTVAVAFVQGAEALLALHIFRVPGATLFGVIAGFLSLVPVVGTGPVTLGAALYLAANGRIGATVGMLIAAVIIGLSDNFVRPFVQSFEGQMHPLMAMLGIFGGLAMMGPAGIFIGPIVSALVILGGHAPDRQAEEGKAGAPHPVIGSAGEAAAQEQADGGRRGRRQAALPARSDQGSGPAGPRPRGLRRLPADRPPDHRLRGARPAPPRRPDPQRLREHLDDRARAPPAADPRSFE